jgi:hypothetical protein
MKDVVEEIPPFLCALARYKLRTAIQHSHLEIGRMSSPRFTRWFARPMEERGDIDPTYELKLWPTRAAPPSTVFHTSY